MLGESHRPWVGTVLQEPVVHDAVDEALAAIRGGADVVQVEVPSGRELMVCLGAAGVAVKPRQARSDRVAASRLGVDLAPAGSQRGLAVLRAAVDAAAAERAGYVRVATSSPALSAPEAAVVVASERIDIVDSDPMEEIVSVGVDPDRALADHHFARQLHRRAGAAIVIGPGPLVVGPDLASGVPSNPATRAGRGLALQLLSARLAAADGLPPDRVILEALPAWLLGEREPFALAAAEVCLRRSLLPENPLAFREPAGSPREGSWPFLLGALLPDSPMAALVLRNAGQPEFAPIAEATRAAAAVAAELAGARDPGRLKGRALEHALATLASAAQTLERLAAHGWDAVLGGAPGTAGVTTGWVGRGADSVTRRTDAFDPTAVAAASASSLA